VRLLVRSCYQKCGNARHADLKWPPRGHLEAEQRRRLGLHVVAEVRCRRRLSEVTQTSS
jgi:hypothetical protein